ncbi:helix-turn-helix domain-containing protein [Bacillus sp. FJAT-28004]|uniref:helix-turn-helix domain-containing protein n=1 Tax=Bacillus sp. FJAT-28004 TaxID=1679165 RepID=UPI0006B4E582|nr:helix-turn-helix domain-containing protein [Bacillus sp. FJAT-28004]
MPLVVDKGWKTVSLLVQENHISESEAVFKAMLDRTLLRLQLPASIIEDHEFSVPDNPTLEQIGEWDLQTQYLLKSGKYEEAMVSFTKMLPLISGLAKVEPSDLIAQILTAILEASNQTNKYFAPAAIMVREIATDTENKYCTTSQAAERLGIHVQSVRRLCEAGRFRGAYQTDGGHWRIPNTAFRTTEEQDKQAKETLERLDRITAERGGTLNVSNEHTDGRFDESEYEF